MIKTLRRINEKGRYKRKTDFWLETKEYKSISFTGCKYKLSSLKNEIITPPLLQEQKEEQQWHQTQGSLVLPTSFLPN